MTQTATKGHHKVGHYYDADGVQYLTPLQIELRFLLKRAAQKVGGFTDEELAKRLNRSVKTIQPNRRAVMTFCPSQGETMVAVVEKANTPHKWLIVSEDVAERLNLTASSWRAYGAPQANMADTMMERSDIYTRGHIPHLAPESAEAIEVMNRVANTDLKNQAVAALEIASKAIDEARRAVLAE